MYQNSPVVLARRIPDMNSSQLGVGYTLVCICMPIDFGHLWVQSPSILCNILMNLVHYPGTAKRLAVLVAVCKNFQSQMCDAYTSLPEIHGVATLKDHVVSPSRHCFQVSRNDILIKWKKLEILFCLQLKNKVRKVFQLSICEKQL